MLELARSSDRDIVNSLAHQIHAMHVEWRPDIYEMHQELFSEERFSEEIRRRQLYVAKIDNEIVGYVLLKICEGNMPGRVNRRILLIDEICVNEICRRQGIGTEIMLEVRALAKAFRCTDLQLGVYPQNDDAVGFYQKCGFTIQSITMSSKL